MFHQKRLNWTDYRALHKFLPQLQILTGHAIHFVPASLAHQYSIFEKWGFTSKGQFITENTLYDRVTSIPIYPLQRVCYHQNLACTPHPPQNDEASYMLLCIEGTKIRNKTQCTPNLKMQWEPWCYNILGLYLV